MKRIFLLLTLLAASSGGAVAQRPAVSILGDSYSTFEGFVRPDTNNVWYFRQHDPKRTDVDAVQQTWWHLFVRRNGCKLCVNNSFSGATVCYTGYRHGAAEHADYRDRSFITRLPELGSPDILFVFGGTNDSWAGSPIGEYQYADWTEQDLYAFRPAMACLCARLIERYPNVKIYFRLNDGLKPEIGETMRTVCDRYGIDCIELHEIDKRAGHPSQKGMRQICEQIETYIQQHP